MSATTTPAPGYQSALPFSNGDAVVTAYLTPCFYPYPYTQWCPILDTTSETIRIRGSKSGGESTAVLDIASATLVDEGTVELQLAMTCRAGTLQFISLTISQNVRNEIRYGSAGTEFLCTGQPQILTLTMSHGAGFQVGEAVVVGSGYRCEGPVSYGTCRNVARFFTPGYSVGGYFISGQTFRIRK